jgi:hypothetical protein
MPDSLVGKYLIADSRLIAVGNSTFEKVLASPDWEQILTNPYLGLGGFYPIKWIEGKEGISGYLVQTPIDLGPSGFPVSLVVVVPTEKLTTENDFRLIYVPIAFAAIFFGFH